MRDLEGAQHAKPEQLVRLEPRYVLPVKDDLPAGWRKIAGHHIEQGGLARPVGPDQPGDRPALDFERAIGNRQKSAKPFGNGTHLDYRVKRHAYAQPLIFVLY